MKRLLHKITSKGKIKAKSDKPMDITKVNLDDVEYFDNGTIVFRNFLTTKQQEELLNKCFVLSENDVNKEINEKNFLRNEKSYNKGAAKAFMFYNWAAFPASFTQTRPDELCDIGKQTMAYAHKLSLLRSDVEEFYRLPNIENPESLYAILYPMKGSFGGHVDGADGWAMSISIGDSATFFIHKTKYTDRKKRKGTFTEEEIEKDRTYIHIRSGDACIFKGGQLEHGVSRIYTDSAPSFWKKHRARSTEHASRMVLQYRDSKDHLMYNPYFYVRQDENTSDVTCSKLHRLGRSSETDSMESPQTIEPADKEENGVMD